MLSLPQTLTQVQAQSCLAQLNADLKAQTTEVVVDGTQLKNFDSSALAVLLELRRECARLGKRFSVRGLPARLRDLASLYGIEALLPTASELSGA